VASVGLIRAVLGLLRVAGEQRGEDRACGVQRGKREVLEAGRPAAHQDVQLPGLQLLADGLALLFEVSGDRLGVLVEVLVDYGLDFAQQTRGLLLGSFFESVAEVDVFLPDCFSIINVLDFVDFFE